MENLEIICTGGTIEGETDYDGTKMAFIKNAKSKVKPYIEKYIRPDFSVSEKVVCMLDSDDITDKEREKIYQAIKKSKAENIIVTHGTNTLANTAQYLANKPINKKVILLGAFQPLTFCKSDAPFNLGFAIASLSSIQNGIYVAMNAKLFNAQEVEKDFKSQKFIALQSRHS